MQLAWTESRFHEERILKKKAVLGPDDGDDKTVVILNRLVTWVCFFLLRLVTGLRSKRIRDIERSCSRK